MLFESTALKEDFGENELNDLLKKAVSLSASDVHFAVGVPPVFRIDGDLIKTKEKVLSDDDIRRIFISLTARHHQEEFQGKGEVDFLYIVEGFGQFRGNAFLCRGKLSIALRLLPIRIPTLAELGHKEVLHDLALKSRGLILVTGSTGSGKSTTVAAMIDLIAREKPCHIITLEDPVEYVYAHQSGIVNQREIKGDTFSFADGLRAALREDPDVIMVGELRDAETIAVALQAALTGHLVLGTLHTFDAVQAVERVINAFSSGQQAQMKVAFGMVIEGIISQQLIKKKAGKGRVAAVEIMIATPAVRTLIREGKTCQIFSCIQTGARLGMQTMDMALKELWLKDLITREDVVRYAYRPGNF